MSVIDKDVDAAVQGTVERHGAHLQGPAAWDDAQPGVAMLLEGADELIVGDEDVRIRVDLPETLGRHFPIHGGDDTLVSQLIFLLDGLLTFVPCVGLEARKISTFVVVEVCFRAAPQG